MLWQKLDKKFHCFCENLRRHTTISFWNFLTFMLSRKQKKCWKLWSNFDTSTMRAKQKVRKMCIQRRFALPNLNDMMLATANCPVLRLSETAPASNQGRWESLADFKGQTMSKWFFQAHVSSKKRTNEFYFTAMKPQVDLFSFSFWRKLKAPKRHFEINW